MVQLGKTIMMTQILVEEVLVGALTKVQVRIIKLTIVMSLRRH